jgi:uncharacterized repeat protein (TIGR03803 family)
MEDSMTNPGEHQSSTRGLSAVAAIRALTIVLMVAIGQAGQTQTLQVLHAFTGGQDGATPYAGVTMDGAGNLYGTASSGGSGGDGTVYQLKHKGSGWVFSPLYSFTGGSDGANPRARVIFGPDGTLYGTTFNGGSDGQGMVFRLRPFARACTAALCPWMETVLHQFAGSPDDGANPGYGDLIFDDAANIFGTTYRGGAEGDGVIYVLMPAGSGWTESVLHNFGSGNGGTHPLSGLVLDNSGNVYGTTVQGGLSGHGTVFQLARSGSGWTESLLYSFDNGSDGSFPVAGLIFDQAGNLYGATSDGGTGGQGTVFELTPANGGWTFSVLYSLVAPPGGFQCGPWGTLVMDGEGNLYGTERCNGASNLGTVFKLTSSGGSWTYTSLHDFTGGNDGKYPYSNVVIDAKGNLYGTASAGGANNQGVVWEISSQ